MMSFLQVFTFLGAILTTSGAPFIDSTSVTSILTGVKRCFSENGIELNLPRGVSDAEMASVIQTDAALYNVTTTCMPNNLSKYKSGLKCAMDVSRICLKQAGNNLDQFLPSSSQIDEALDYLCANKENFDAKCVTSSSVKTEIKACITTRVKGSIRAGMSVIEAACTGAGFVVPCTREKTAKCGTKSSKTFTEMNRIIVPKVCDEYLMTKAILTTSVAPTIDCTSVTSMLNGVKQCFSDNGVELNLQTGTSDAAMANVIQTDAALYNVTTTCMPNHLLKYKSSLKCAMDVFRPCLKQAGNNLDQFLPSASQIDEALDYLCVNKENFDAKCVTSSSVKTEIMACSTTRAKASIRAGMSPIEAGCITGRFLVLCTREKTAKCGWKSSEVYTEINRIMIPTMCDEYLVTTESHSATYPVTGDGYHVTTDSHPATGGAHRLPFASSLLVLICLVQYISFRL